MSNVRFFTRPNALITVLREIISLETQTEQKSAEFFLQKISQIRASFFAQPTQQPSVKASSENILPFKK